jgi:uncharacterized membrane protein
MVVVSLWLSSTITGEEENFIISSGLSDLLATAFTVWLMAGVTVMFLKISRGKTVDYDEIFRHYHLIVPLMIIGILRTVAIVFGLILFIVPGIVFAVALSLSEYIAIDKKLGPIESLRKSYYATSGHRFKLFFFLLISALFNLLGLFALGIGLLITIPITFFATLEVYKKLV